MLKDFLRLVFYLWILCLPFYRFSVIGTLSLDNLLAPFLLLASPLVIFGSSEPGEYRTKRRAFVVLGAIAAYALVFLLVYFSKGTMVKLQTYHLVKFLSYLVIPLLYVTNPLVLRRACYCLLIAALISCTSALLSSVGLIQLDFARYSPSRIGIEELPKATGIVGSYGDLAMFMVVSLLFALSPGLRDLMPALRSPWTRAAIALFVLVGVIGSQSRNIVLSLVIALVTLKFLQAIRGARADLRMIAVSVFILVALFTAAFLGLNVGSTIEVIGALGGEQAAMTAGARLLQYEEAWQYFARSPILGVRVDSEQRFLEVNSIHNMWFRLAAQSGIVGVVSTFCGLFTLFVWLYRNAMRGPSGDLARVGVTLLVAMGVSTLFYPANSTFFWFYVGLLLAFAALSSAQAWSVQRAARVAVRPDLPQLGSTPRPPKRTHSAST